MFELRFDTRNAAFDGPDRRHEVARILRELADRVEHRFDDDGPVSDMNGNKVGRWSLTANEERI